MYEEMAVTESDQDLDILNWWKQQQDQLPLLASLARTHLCVPASVSGGGVVVVNSGINLEESVKLAYINANLNRVVIIDWILDKDLDEAQSDGELVIGI